MRGWREGLEDDLPVPALVLFLLNRVLGYRQLDPGDKGRWAVGCSVAGEPVAFRDRKFGFEILVAPGSTLEQKRILFPLKAALRVLEEELLVPEANEQIHDCRVAVINRFGEFSHRYQYFRTKADELFAQAEIRPSDRKGMEGLPSISAVTAEMNRAAVAEREAFFLSAAMVDAYYSLLEHRLILLRAFTGKPMAAGDFEKLLGANWEGKLVMVLDLNSKGREGKELLGELRRIKERIRNPFAHGGVENDRGSIYVQLGSFGAVPANFSRARNSIRFNFRPIVAEDHAAMCGVFDRLDAFLETDDLSLPHRFLDSSVDPAFDAGMLTEYTTAIKDGGEAVDEWIDRWSREWERHQNADY
ncbi:hypothetical protein Hsar01_03233 [Haloferula sargassicola]|uniref:Apea-like HEPN domain-containing protein n=2 Tax=Haloferula sargassicola TaxID=490096 RepID=A0ABP9UTG9_9BACT